MSYRVGPHEGWIALKRSRALVPILEVLPSDLQADVIEEFASLVQNHLYAEAADLFLTQELHAQTRLFEGVTKLNWATCQEFASVLRARGAAMAFRSSCATRPIESR